MSQRDKRSLFAQQQESGQKNVQQTIRMVQAWFSIVCSTLHTWNVNTMKPIILACIILHNMIVKDDRDTYVGNIDYDHTNNDFSTSEISACPNPSLRT